MVNGNKVENAISGGSIADVVDAVRDKVGIERADMDFEHFSKDFRRKYSDLYKDNWFGYSDFKLKCYSEHVLIKYGVKL